MYTLSVSVRTYLVGDHHQLPPLVKHRGARKAGMDVSLFKRLSDAHPAAVATLAVQFRMHADVMLLSNTLVYGGRLRCGTAAIAAALATHLLLQGLRVPRCPQCRGCPHESPTP